MTSNNTYVVTADIKAAVQGHEEKILDRLGIDWRRGRPHIACPYPGHGGQSDWRWDAKKGRAYCTCTPKGDGVIDVVRQCEGLDFDAAKVRAAEIIGRTDLVKTKRSSGQQTDAASLLDPPEESRDRELPRAYLARRLGIPADEALMPSTAATGWRALPYYDPPAKPDEKPVLVGEFACAVFATVAADGGTHAHRVYVQPGGTGKAALGKDAAGHYRDPKKSARVGEGASTAGRSVIWGDPARAERVLLAEGIETAAAVAHAFRREIEAGGIVVAAAISAGGIEAFKPYPATKRVTVAADRDEAVKPGKAQPSRTGERAAREFGLRNRRRCEIHIALPGGPGTSTDWLDILCADGVDMVRAGIEGAVRFEPTKAEIEDRTQRMGSQAALEQVAETYPLPELHSKKLAYRHVKGSVWVHKIVTVGKGDDKTEVAIPISTPFGIPARLRFMDEAESYGLRLIVQDMNGEPRPIDIDRGDLAALAAVEARKMLLSAGLRVEEDGEQIAVQCLKAAHPELEIAIVRHPGWHTIDENRTYVAPDGSIFGLPRDRRLELSGGSRLSPSVARGGTLDGWKEAAAAALSVRDCPHWAIGIASGFAGVLINLCGMDSCGISYSGQTSAGKTTGQRLAASCWSKPDPTTDGLFQTAKTTVNGLEHMAARATGSVFVMDELAHLSGKETARVIYTLASGTGKKRMTASATVREAHRWQTFAILSAETSLEAKIKADGEQWTGGQAVRVVDVDVSTVNRTVAPDILAKIATISAHYGHAGPAFASALVDAGTHRNAAEVRAGINEVARRLAGNGPNGSAADAATVRAAIPFAVLTMAGRMAKAFRLIPETADIGAAVRWAWNGFLKSSDAAALDPAAQAIGNIRQWVAERWNTSIHGIEAETRPTRDALGWWDDEAVYLAPGRLCEAAGGTLKEQVIARALDAADLLAKTKSENNLAIYHVPKVGAIKAYALSRNHFGHGTSERSPFKAYAGGRP